VRSSLQADPTKRGGRWVSDFVWNQNWKEALDIQDDVRRQVEEGRRAAAEGANADGKGFLSLGTKVDLNSMDVDLSAALRRRPEKEAEEKARRAAGAAAAEARRRGAPAAGGYAANPAFRGETRQWDRSGRYARKVVATPVTGPDAEEAEAQLAAERARYDELKRELQAWATGLTTVCLIATATFYGRDVAASYGAGALGGLIYLRLLHRSVDGIGAGGIGAALGSNRLLIPLILALGYNRFNTMFAEPTGLTLQLLPMLVGFFTYKGAVIARQSLVLFGELTEGAKGGAGNDVGGSSKGQEGNGEGIDVVNVDRAFNKKMLSG
jgi:ATP synthase protein I